MAVIPTTITLGTTVNVLTLAAGSPGGLNPASTIDPANDYLSIYTASATATQGINRNTLLNLTSQPVGISDTQTLSNKTIGDTNTILAKDGAFTLQNSSDITKQGVFSLAGLTTGNTRTYTLPNYNATLASLGGTETLTAKTLTSPTINSPTITNATISADSISGYTTTNTGNIYGIGISAGVITSANTIATGTIVQNGVGASQLAATAITLGYVQIVTNFTTTSTTVVQVTGLTTTVTIPAGGRYIKITSYIGNPYNATTGDGYELSLWDGVVGTGTQLNIATNENGLGDAHFIHCMAVVKPSGSKTYNVGLRCITGGTLNTQSSSTSPSFILVEAI